MAEIGGFHEVQFPTNISMKSRGGPGFQTNIIELDSGHEQRVSRHLTAGQRRYNVAYGIREQGDLYTVQEFFIARRGHAYGFRYKDWTDYTTAANGRDDPDDEDEVIGTGDASETQFQLVKRYTSGGVIRVRNIRKPVSGTVVVALDGAAQTEGADFTVDTTTGIVTFSSAPGGSVVVSAGCEFDVPVRFAVGSEETLYANIEAYGSGTMESIELLEIMGDAIVQDEYFYGGAAEIDLTADISITPLTGRALAVNPDVNGHAIILTDPTDLEPGGPYHMIKNDSNSKTFNICYPDAGTTIVTVGASSWAIVCLSYDGGVKSWTVLAP
jgi:uncharacterized protein (TIGR02217 family)